MTRDGNLDNRQTGKAREGELDAWMRLAPDACLLTDESGTIAAANEPAAVLLNVPQESLAGQSIAHFLDVSASDDKGLPAWLGMVAEGEQRVKDATLCDGNGDPIAAEVRVLRSSRDGRDVFHWLVRDATTPRGMEGGRDRAGVAALHLSEAKLRAVFDALVEGVVFLNAEGQVEEVNAAIQRRHGHTLHELADPELDPRTRIIRPDGTLFPVDEQPAMVALRTGQPVRDVEMGVPTRDGQIRWRLVNATPVYDDSKNLLGAVVSFFDITEQKEAGLALRESEERFRAAIEHAGFTPAEADRELRYRWIYNPHPDFDPALVVGKRDDELDDSPGTHKLVALKQRVVDTGVAAREEIAFERSDGVHIYDLRITPLRGGDGSVTGLSSVAIDITEHRRLQEALRGERELLQTIYDTIPIMLAIYDPRIETVTLNKHVERLTGWTGEDTARRSIMELAYPDPEYRAKVAAYMQSRQPGFRGIQMVTKDGRTIDTIWANVEILDGRQVGIGLDVTEQVRARQEVERAHAALRRAHDELETRVIERTRALRHAYEDLQRAEEELRVQNEELLMAEDELRLQNEELAWQQRRYQALFDLAPGAYLVTDRSGTIYEANQAAADLLGVPVHDLPGTRLDSYVLAADGAPYDKQLDTLRSGDGAQTAQWEMRVQQPSGGIIATAVTATPVSATSQQANRGQAGVRWLLRDVRREKQMQAALVQAEKMALTGQLAASLAHEINNPLAAALGSIELVREALADGENPEPLLDVMHASLARAARVVSQLREVRRHTGPEEKQPADLNTLVENVLLLTGKTASAAGVEISWERADDVPTLPLMVDGMQQVFLNLVLNGIEAMPGRGKLAVRIRRAEQPARIGPAVGIEFADTGPGIAPEMRDRLFNPFETTKEGGSGLGLFISRNIVEQHGGEIEVGSVEGEGATFTVWLPEPSSWGQGG